MPDPLPSIQPASPAPGHLPPSAGSPLGQKPTPVKHHRIRGTFIIVGILAVIFVVVAGWVLYRAIAVINTKSLDGSNKRIGFFQQFTRLVTQTDEQIKGESDDRINILLLGIGGPGHDGPYLTDTMIVMSYQPSSDRVAMISIPRDLVVDIPGYDFRKINNVLSIGRDNDYPGGGEALTVKVVSDLLNLPIQYYARVDFNGFAEVIDQVNGVTVNVETSFYDPLYPDNNYGYDPISFKKGVQEMDGATALKFARSRHGTNGEGSDFARAARQQKIIYALKEKLLSFGTLSNPLKISDILESLGSHSQTNMEVWEIVRLAKLASDVPAGSIVNRVIDSSPTGLLKNATGLGGAFILIPRDETYGDLRFFAKNIFALNAAAVEKAEITVINATTTTGLADTTAKGLLSIGLDASAATVRNVSLPQTVVIDLSNGRAPQTLQLLNRYGQARRSMTLTEWESTTGDTTLRTTVTSTNTNRANLNAAVPGPGLVLVLGQDQVATVSSSTNNNTNTTE